MQILQQTCKISSTANDNIIVHNIRQSSSMLPIQNGQNTPNPFLCPSCIPEKVGTNQK
jgi:hypothetical protein